MQGRMDPTVSIQVASDDETSTEGTDDTFSIHRLERTRQSLEALFGSQTPLDSEAAQETLLSPNAGLPSFSRTGSHMSSGQASFVTAHESLACEDETKRSISVAPRPLATPAQTPWSSTSFAREYFETDDTPSEPNRSSDPTSLASKRASSRASQSSFIDFDDIDDGVAPTIAFEPSSSPLSFLDDFSPPSSAPPSPAIASVPTMSRSIDPAVPTIEPGSLPTSPTLSSTFTEAEANRLSQLTTNRDSYLSVDSNNLRISPTAAKFVNGGSGGDLTPRSHSYNSSRSNVLNSFPVPPVEETEETGSDGDDEEEEAEDDIIHDPTLNGRGHSLATRRYETSDMVEALEPATVSPRQSVASEQAETNHSFLDVSDPSDNESKRWSRELSLAFCSE